MFSRPTLAQLVTRTVGDLETELQAVGSVLRRAMVRVIAQVQAGASHLLHGHLDFLARQFFPDLSEEEYLVRQGGLYGLTRTPPTYARAMVELSGDGTPVPAGTILTRADGAEYELIADLDTSIPTEGEVIARVFGAGGTLPVGAVVSLQSPIAGVDSTGTVTDSTADGSDEEATESFRQRVLGRMASPPQGGNDSDFIAWALEVSGVTRAWVTKWGLGPGTVVVRFARDNDVSPIPDSGEIADVQAHMDDPEEGAPTAAGVTVAPLVAMPINFIIDATPNTAGVRSAIKARLQAKLKRTSPAVVIPVSALETAIGSAQGIVDFTMNSPNAPLSPAANQLPLLGTVTINGVPT